MPWYPFGIGGVNNVFTHLAWQLRDRGAYDPHVVLSGSLVPGGEVEIDGVKVHRLDVWGPSDPRHPLKALASFLLRLPTRCRSLRGIIAENNIEVINPHFPDLGALNFVVMKKLHLFDGKFVLSLHGSDLKRDIAVSRGFERLLWRWLLRGADSIVTVSNDLAADLLAFEPSVAAQVRTIFNGVDTRLFSPAPEAPDAWSGPRWARPVIVSTGAFEDRKAHDVLVHAFARARGRHPQARLVLIGQSGPSLAGVRALISSLGLAEQVEIHCDVPHRDVARYLSTATLYASASRFEGGLALALLEAGATRIPVVCTRARGQRELITDGVTGRVVEVDDAAALAEAIADLLQHPDEARLLACNLYEEVRTKFTWPNTCEAYVSLARGELPSSADSHAVAGAR